MSTAVAPPASPADHAGAARPQGEAAAGPRLARWLPATAVGLVLVAALLATGTPALDILRYAGYVAWALVLPGTLVYRALRGTPHSLVDDLAMGAAVGFALEIAAYTAVSAVGLRELLWAWPLLVVVPFLAVPALRRHWRPAGYRPVPLAWAWTVAAIAIGLVGYVAIAFFRPNPLPPAASRGHVPDLYYMLSLIAEAKHHFPLRVPQIAAEPLTYHWFTYAHEASASLISGVDTPTVFFRLALPVMCVVAVVLLAVVGWRVSGKLWVGPLAAALMFTVGEFGVTDTQVPPFGTVVAFIVWGSHSMTYSWLFGIALIAIVADRLNPGGLPGAPLRRGGWVLLALLAVAAAGAKPTVLTVTLGGIGLVFLVELVRRRRLPLAALGAGAVVAAAIALLAVLLTQPGSYGLTISPFHDAKPYLASKVDRPMWKDLGVLGLVATAFVVSQLPRLAGIPVLAKVRRSWGPIEFLLLGATLAGIGGTLLFGHQSYGQQYFIKSAWAFGAILSAMGFVALVERHRLRASQVTGIVAAVGLLAAAGTAFLWWLRPASTGPAFHLLVPMLTGAAILVAIGVVAAGVWLFVRRGRPRLRGLGAVTALAAVLACGAPGIVLESRKYIENPTSGAGFAAPVVNGDHVVAGRWIREHTRPDDVLATNDHRLGPRDDGGWVLSFWLPAYAERRTLVGSWAYAPWVIAEATKNNQFFVDVPFRDAELLAFNDAVFYDPTQERIDRMRDDFGIRWLVVDRDEAPESPALARFATLRYERGPVAVYEISAAAGTGS